MNEEKWNNLTNCERLNYRISELDLSEDTINKLSFELANIQDETFELEDKLDKIKAIIYNKNITGIEARLLIQDILEGD